MAAVATHDASKFSPEEYEPYVRLTWWYKENGAEGKKPPKSILGGAWKLHCEANDHHPEFWAKDPTKMTATAIAHMVADYAAMSVENNNGLLDWIEKKTFVKYTWTDEQKDLIRKYAEWLCCLFPKIPSRTPVGGGT